MRIVKVLENGLENNGKLTFFFFFFGAEPRPAPPGFTPPLPHSQRVSSCSGDPRDTTKAKRGKGAQRKLVLSVK